MLLTLVGVAAPLGKVHGKAVGAASQELVWAGGVEEVMRRGCLPRANAFGGSWCSVVGIPAGMPT